MVDWPVVIAVVVTILILAFALDRAERTEKHLCSLLSEARLWLPKTEQGEDLDRRILKAIDQKR